MLLTSRLRGQTGQLAIPRSPPPRWGWGLALGGIYWRCLGRLEKYGTCVDIATSWWGQKPLTRFSVFEV